MEIAKATRPEEWKYFAKGAANILFIYKGSHDYLKRKLLRVRLLKADEEYISTCELYDFIELTCKPLFPNLLIDVQLVVLDFDFVQSLHSDGNKMMLKEKYGLIIPNILEGQFRKINLSKHSQIYINDSYTLIIFELKPKWLYDNQNNYCRTCLLAQSRKYNRHFCPLDFLYSQTIDRGLDDLFSFIPKQTMAQISKNLPIKTLFKKFLNNPNCVFQKLKKYQKIDNTHDLVRNLKSPEDVSPELSLVMTLRDVGLFIKFEVFDPINDFHNLNSNLSNINILDSGKFLTTCSMYDLDLKSSAKYTHWLKVEKNLSNIYNSDNPDWRPCVRADTLIET